MTETGTRTGTGTKIETDAETGTKIEKETETVIEKGTETDAGTKTETNMIEIETGTGIVTGGGEVVRDPETGDVATGMAMSESYNWFSERLS